jgi:hypothetical protein
MLDKALKSELYTTRFRLALGSASHMGALLTYNIKIVPILHEVVILLQEMCWEVCNVPKY